MGILNIDNAITEETLIDNGFKKAFVGYYGADETGNVAILYANQFKKRKGAVVDILWPNLHLRKDSYRTFQVPMMFTYYHSNCFITPLFMRHHIKDCNGYVTAEIIKDNMPSSLRYIDIDDFKCCKKVDDIYDLNAFVLEKLKDVEAYIQNQVYKNKDY